MVTGKDTKNEKSSDSKTKKPEVKEVELSEEDAHLKESLDTLVAGLTEGSDGAGDKLAQIAALIRSATTSMTSVPKPLKFLMPHYAAMKEVFEKLSDASVKKDCADILSILSMVVSDQRDCLSYRLLGQRGDVGSWGHEYVRHLAGEIGTEYETSERKDQLLEEAHKIVPYHMKHNAESEACDLLMEMEQLDILSSGEYVDKDAYERVCLYLTSCVPYVGEPENINLLKTALKIYRKFDQYPQAMRLALQLHDFELITDLFKNCPDRHVRMQLAFMLGRQQVYIEVPEEMEDAEDLVEILSNANLSNNFLSLARELDIIEPKVPEDIYKTHLDTRPAFSVNAIDSARSNLAASFVNGFVNAGFGSDKLITEDGNKWLYKNKEHGMMSATASLGLILLWDVDGGLTKIDKYFYSSDDFIKAGALLACGIVSSGVRNECDPAIALLSEFVPHKVNMIRIGAIFGLGLAYAGSNREEIISLLVPVLGDEKATMEVVGVTALSLGLVCVGTANQEVTEALVTALLAKTQLQLKDTYAKFISLGLALVYLGYQEKCDVILDCVADLPVPFRQMTKTLIEVCAYAGTGNVLKIQEMLQICTDHYGVKDKDKKDKKETKSSSKDDKAEESTGDSASDATSSKDKDAKDKESKDKKEEEVDLSCQQQIACLGIALIAMGEDIGADMCYRQFGNLLRYCEPAVRRAVPLALALSSVSNPKLHILDTLSKFSHDSDSEVAYNATLAMGIVGAGTNNARLAAMLRQLAQYHVKDPNSLFMVRLAQGLTHLGKGTLSLSAYHCNRHLMAPVAVAGLLATCVAALDVRTVLLGKSHYLLYALVPAMQPRMLVTFDEELSALPVSVRVGQAVDVVGQAGRPKAITGFQTHTTPVLLAHGERAELATEEYLPLTPVMEGFVILRKNPDYVE